MPQDVGYYKGAVKAKPTPKQMKSAQKANPFAKAAAKARPGGSATVVTRPPHSTGFI